MERIKKAIEKARTVADARSTGASDAFGLTTARTKQPGLFQSAVKVSPVDPRALERHRIIAGDKIDPRTVAFDILRTQVLSQMQKNGWRTLGVTSPGLCCGKTTVSINLSLSIAQQLTSRVLLAEFDLRRPKIAKYLGVHPESDLSDFLEGRVPLEGALVDPGIPRLLVLPNGKAFDNAAEMISKPEVVSLIQGLKYDDTIPVIIFDLPPVLATDDTLAFLPQVDCVLLVVADGLTTISDLQETLRLLSGTNLVGVVLNKWDSNAARQGSTKREAGGPG